jgi:signal peptidase I
MKDILLEVSDEIPGNSGYCCFLQVKGGSMWPIVRQDDKLLTRKVEFSALRTADIILYRNDAGLVCHRFVRVGQKGSGAIFLYCRGDTSYAPSEKVLPQSLIGRVDMLIREGKIVDLRGFIARFFGVLIILSVPCWGFIFHFYLALCAKIKKAYF